MRTASKRHRPADSISNPARFLARCAIRKALRTDPGFLRGRPFFVGLVIAGDCDKVTYEAAATSILREKEGDRFKQDCGFRVTFFDPAKRKAAIDYEDFAGKERVLALARRQEDIPPQLRVALDRIVDIGKLDPRHVQAAVRCCLGQVCTPNEARQIAAFPRDIVALCLRKGRSIRDTIAAMQRAAAPELAEPSAGSPRLEHLHGMGEAGLWGQELARDLNDWAAGTIPWSDVDKGVLISGPPGTGKTTFARALATTCGAHLVLGSIGRWQSKGHLGDMLKSMQQAFDEARANIPSIIFLDELDALGDRENLDDQHRQYTTEVIATLLEHVDGADRREGVVVVGATNHPSRIDAAMLRPGRLDRHIRIPLPDEEGRAGILRWHLGGQLGEADLSAVVVRTAGWSGAALEQVVRDARRRARRSRRNLDLADLLACLPPVVPIPERIRFRAAVHEAGHAVVAMALGRRFDFIELADTAMLTSGRQAAGGMITSSPVFQEQTGQTLLDEICVALAGLAAEEVIFGDRSAGGGGVEGSDLHQATLWALRLEASYGLGQGLAYLSADEELSLRAALHTTGRVQERVDKVLSAQLERAISIVKLQSTTIRKAASALMERGRLSETDVRALVVAKSPDRSAPDPDASDLVLEERRA